MSRTKDKAASTSAAYEQHGNHLVFGQADPLVQTRTPRPKGALAPATQTASEILDALSVMPVIALTRVEDVATAVMAVCEQLGIPRGMWEDLTGDTVTYYRRLRIVSSPEGRTVKSVYGRRHVLEALGAKLVGSSVTTMTLRAAAEKWGQMHQESELLEEIAQLVDRARALAAPRPLAEVMPTTTSATGVVRGTVVQAGAAQILLPLGYPSASVANVARLVARVVEAGERSDAEVLEMARVLDQAG